MMQYREYIVATFATVLIACVIIITRASIANPNAAINLQDYKILQHSHIPNIGDDLSGITFSPNTQTLFTIVDIPTRVVELNLKGDVLRSITLHQFQDTEAIAHISGNKFAILQEGRRRVVFADIDATTTQLNANQLPGFNLDYNENTRKGLEGLAWSNSQGLYLANEQQPSRVTRLPVALFSGLTQGSSDNNPIMPQQIEQLPVKDISGLHVAEQAKRLLVLSDESRRILELDFDGTIHSEFKLTTGLFDLTYIMEQPEGVTMDDQDRIYIVGEPNIFVVLAKTNNQQLAQTPNRARSRTGLPN